MSQSGSWKQPPEEEGKMRCEGRHVWIDTGRMMRIEKGGPLITYMRCQNCEHRGWKIDHSDLVHGWHLVKITETSSVVPMSRHSEGEAS